MSVALSRLPRRLAALIWASPWTVVGLAFGLIALATGGGARRRGPVIEFYGGMVAWFFGRFLAGFTAMTLGHTVLGRTAAGLDFARPHELVHVRQYERWGPLFVPAYFLSSFVAWRRGDDPYRQNRFEREAFHEAP